jgi:UDP-N-acetylglucosamine 2-epimerase
VRALKPLGFLDYVKLQVESFCVLSDSGTLTEESALLGFPAITIRQAHERPEGMDEGTLIMCDLSAGRVLDAVRVVTNHRLRNRLTFRTPPDYDTEQVSKKVLRIIMSYVDYVRRTVWFDSGVPA